MDERTWVKAILDGDQAARDRLYRQFQPRIRKAAIYFLGQGDPDLDDVVQETFMAALSNLGAFEFKSSLYTWLNHICVNKCFSLIRHRKRSILADQGVLEQMAVPAPAGQEKDLLAKERRGLFEGWLSALGGPCRKLLKLRLEKGLAFIKIADRLKENLGTVTARMARCVAKLKAMAQKERHA